MNGSIQTTWEPQRAIDYLTENAREVLLEAAEYCWKRYLTYAPVDTGDMIASSGVKQGVNENEMIVYVKMFYSVYVEFGHFSVAGNWVSPNPALRMAVSDTVTAFPQIAAKVSRS